MSGSSASWALLSDRNAALPIKPRVPRLRTRTSRKAQQKWREAYCLRLPNFQQPSIAQALMLPLIAGATLYLRGRDDDRRVGPGFLSDMFTWLAFFGISAVAAYSVLGLFKELQQWVIKTIT